MRKRYSVKELLEGSVNDLLSKKDIMNLTHFRTESQLLIGEILWTIVSPVMVVFGTLGNVLSIVVLSRKRFIRKPSSVYLIGLAISDICLLSFGLFRTWLLKMLRMDASMLPVVLCQLDGWLVYSNSHVSSWILVSITMERLISTSRAYRLRPVCTVPRACLVLTFILVCSLSINSHFLFGMGKRQVLIENTTITVLCVPLTDTYTNFLLTSWNWINLSIFSLVPLAILCTGNIVLIGVIVSSHRASRRQITPADSNVDSETARANRKMKSMVKLLCAINMMFLFSTVPICVYLTGAAYWIPPDVPIDVRQNDPFAAVVFLVFYLNNAVNFLLYCVSGSMFRNELRVIFASFVEKIRPRRPNQNAL